ncbi:MAG: protein tyrosine phosphatase family protein [Chromatiales bacterium]|jgi:protein tyrosine phosphatase (PTP) superfamily phosphohydrolase (DUF442 family)
MQAENTFQVFDWLWTSGQLSRTDILEVADMDVAAVINLALPTSSNALPEEAALVTEQGMAYVQIPVEWEAPRAEQFKQFVGAMDAFKGDNIWLHCAKNMRVSAFVYLYRKLELLESEDNAAYPMREIWQPNAIWQAFIDQVLVTYRND